MSDPVRIGLIGAGAVVQVAHMPVLKRLKSVELAAICDTDLPKARALASRFGIPDVFDDIEDLLGHERVDALLIATPNHLHESHILAALAAGCHVLVEKPLALTAAAAQRIAKAAEKRDRVVLPGMTHRYRPDAQAVRSFIQNGELGEIDSMRSSWHVARPARTALGWRQRKDEAGGGAMLEFNANSNRTYSVLFTDALDSGVWQKLFDVPARSSARLESVSDPDFAPNRYYRLTTPRVP